MVTEFTVAGFRSLDTILQYNIDPKAQIKASSEDWLEIYRLTLEKTGERLSNIMSADEQAWFFEVGEHLVVIAGPATEDSLGWSRLAQHIARLFEFSADNASEVHKKLDVIYGKAERPLPLQKRYGQYRSEIPPFNFLMDKNIRKRIDKEFSPAESNDARNFYMQIARGKPIDEIQETLRLPEEMVEKLITWGREEGFLYSKDDVLESLHQRRGF